MERRTDGWPQAEWIGHLGGWSGHLVIWMAMGGNMVEGCQKETERM